MICLPAIEQDYYVPLNVTMQAVDVTVKSDGILTINWPFEACEGNELTVVNLIFRGQDVLIF